VLICQKIRNSVSPYIPAAMIFAFRASSALKVLFEYFKNFCSNNEVLLSSDSNFSVVAGNPQKLLVQLRSNSL